MEKWIRNWFSNMLPFDTPLKYQDIDYPTVEHFYQALKLPKDRTDLRLKLSKMTPYEAKKAVKTKEFLPWSPTWSEEMSLIVMEIGLKYKFGPETSWHKKLMDTGDDEIVEYNNWGDVFFGVDVKTGKGQNHLGKILMKLRNEYKLLEKL